MPDRPIGRSATHPVWFDESSKGHDVGQRGARRHEDGQRDAKEPGLIAMNDQGPGSSM
jgi:hypothetical protein